MGGAGVLLRRELASADARGAEAWRAAGRRAAWARYSDAGQRVGDAYRAAMAAGLDMPAGVWMLNLGYRDGDYGRTTEPFWDMAAYQARLIELAARRDVELEYTGIVRFAS
jgi:hypothetical protein